MDAKPGLHHVPDGELVRLLRIVFRDQLTFPITRAGLLLAKVGELEGQLDALVGQNKSAAIAILSAVLHERRHRQGARNASLIWSGPAPSGGDAKSAEHVFAEFIATAERSLLFTGADLRRDARALRSIHAAMRGRALAVTIVLGEDARASDASALFHGSGAKPQLYTPDPSRVQMPLPMCLIADDTRALIVSGAAPEPEADERSVTAGIVLDDAAAARALASQWRSLIDDAALLPLMAAAE
ncbi:MAG TPA: hypothetical protein VHZ95_20820 [Polyangiales bacterium]|jgi:hypothetical protein|nr:hypothetical protein [Polyangiales bacterium]